MRTLSLLPLVALLLAPLTLMSPPAAADSLDEILERGTLRVGTALFVPWAVRDSGGKLTGFEAEVARQLAADLGVEPQIETMSFEQLIPALEDGAIDLIAAGLSVTPGRARQVAYSDPYATSGINLVVNRELGGGLKSLAAFDKPEVRIAAVRETTAADLARSVFPNADLFLLTNEEEVQTAVLTRRVLAAVASDPLPELLRLGHPDKVVVPLSEPLVRTAEAFGVRRGEQGLLNFLNSWIVFRTLDGWLPERREYWFGTLAWQAELPPESRIIAPGE
jgi:polar amino acid transport system substrate-binding protein